MSRRSAWPWLIAGAAIAYLTVMVVTGELAPHGHFNLADTTGLMHEPAEAVTSLDLTRSAQTIHLIKQGGLWRRPDGTVLDSHRQEHIAGALGFMHTARPVRTLTNVGRKAVEFGLQPPQLTVQLRNDVGVLLQFDLGGTIPDGILRYLRVTGETDVTLVSGFVGEGWDHLADDLFLGE